MITRFAKCNEASAPEDGGAGGTALVETPTPTPAPEPAPKAEAPPKLTPEALRAKLTASSKRAQDEIEALKAEVASLKTATEAEKAKVSEEFAKLTNEKLDLAFERAKVKPEYRDFAKQKLGSLDLSKAEDLAKIDTFAKAHPAMVASVATEQPATSWVDVSKINTGIAQRLSPEFIAENFARLKN